VSVACPLCGFAAQEADVFCGLCGASLHAVPRGASARPPTRGYVELPGGERVEVTDAPVAVGREQLRAFAQGPLAAAISRVHFTVVRRQGRFMIEDGPGPAQPKPSANGTWVRGATGAGEVRLTPGSPVELKGGEAIDVARVLRLRFEVEGA